MALLRFILIVLLACILIGCTKTVYVPTTHRVEIEKTVEIRDTVINYKLEYKRDTITTQDSVSFLSNDYSYSWASLSNGKLTHSLTVWKRPVPVTVPVETKYITRREKESYPVYIEKELKTWQKFMISFGFICLVGLVLFILFRVVR